MANSFNLRSARKPLTFRHLNVLGNFEHFPIPNGIQGHCWLAFCLTIPAEYEEGTYKLIDCVAEQANRHVFTLQ
jgi:hypothetical protein